MTTEDFAERLALVRSRFSQKLAGRLAEIEQALPLLAAGDAAAATLVADTHRRVHDLCGIGPTLGFVATGQAARVVERILLPPFKAERALTEEELEQVRAGIQALRQAVVTELKSA